MLNIHGATPLHFAASKTANFVAATLPNKADQLLDVGCGDGLIARQLQLAGYDVVAIDASEKAIERAKRNSVDALHCKFEDLKHPAFDGILISRALHHMSALTECTNSVAKLLKKNGTLMIDDFGFEFADEAACEWLFEQSKKVLSTGCAPQDCQFKHQWLHQAVVDSGEAYALWKTRYTSDHKLWSAAEMMNAIEKSFRVHKIEKIPYLFRFICDLLPDTADGAEQARKIFNQEQDLIDTGEIAAVGLRIVALKS